MLFILRDEITEVFVTRMVACKITTAVEDISVCIARSANMGGIFVRWSAIDIDRRYVHDV